MSHEFLGCFLVGSCFTTTGGPISCERLPKPAETKVQIDITMTNIDSISSLVFGTAHKLLIRSKTTRDEVYPFYAAADARTFEKRLLSSANETASLELGHFDQK